MVSLRSSCRVEDYDTTDNFAVPDGNESSYLRQFCGFQDLPKSFVGGVLSSFSRSIGCRHLGQACQTRGMVCEG